MFQIICPKKGILCSNFFKRGVTESGKQRYCCRECGFVTVGEREKRKSNVEHLTCKKCNTKSVVMNGTYNSYKLRQRFYCKNCKRTFSYES